MKYLDLQGYQDSIRTSRIAMGSAMGMMRLQKEEVWRIFDRYLDLGGNCLDTARAYGDGRCEDMVGEYLRASGKRSQIVISTKGCHPIGGDDGPSRLSWEYLDSDINASLKSLSTDCIDIYWIHKDDESLPVEPIVDNINRIIKAGKVRFVGCSNWHIDRIQAANAYAKASGQQGFLGSQIQWSFSSTKEEYFKEHGSVVMTDESYNWYLEQNMPVFAFSSQASGFCAKLRSMGFEALPPHLQKFYGSPENLERYERALKVAKEQNIPIAAPVVAYITNNRLPGVAIIGATKLAQLDESMLGGELDLTAEQVDWMYKG